MRKYRFSFLKVVEGIKLTIKNFLARSKPLTTNTLQQEHAHGGEGCWGHEASLELTESLKH